MCPSDAGFPDAWTFARRFLIAVRETLLALPHSPDWGFVLQRTQQENPWWTPAHVEFARQAWLDALTEKDIDQWLSRYPALQNIPSSPGDSQHFPVLGLVLPANIPFVGLEDILAGIVAGYQIELRISERARTLMQFFLQNLIQRFPDLHPRLQTVDRLSRTRLDAVIVSGSHQTIHIFRQYLGNIPGILRGTRSSTAILTDEDSPRTDEGIARDILMYFGLGCRNISFIWVPSPQRLNRLIRALAKWHNVREHPLYHANWEYQYAVCLVNRIPHVYSPEVIFRQDQNPFSGVGVVHYAIYENLSSVHAWLQQHQHHLQCVVAESPHVLPDFLPASYYVLPGRTQLPRLWDFPDHIDTVQFLLNLRKSWNPHATRKNIPK